MQSKNYPPVMTQKDWVYLLVLIAVYSFVAFVNLGNIRSPQTAWIPSESPSDTAVLRLDDTVRVTQFQYMNGARHDSSFALWAVLDSGEQMLVYQSQGADVFAWHSVSIDVFTNEFIIVDTTGTRSQLRLQEVAFRGADGKLLFVTARDPFRDGTSWKLVDEQHLVPESRSFMNSTYFDEIYHARTGYEFLHGLPVYETTHPPLGKVFIAASTALFGMTPFAWRLPGVLFGILMIPLLYAFAREIFKSNHWGLFAAFIFTFDFMHFSQTRLATIDTYVVFFVMAMYFFMYLYVQGINSGRYTFKQSLAILTLCGAATGLAIASKWQGAYGALGLPVLFFPAWFKLYKSDKRQGWITFAACFGIFIMLPLAIYLLSYIPFVNAQTGTENLSPAGWLQIIWDNQVLMLTYHSYYVLGTTDHPFASEWWSWPLMLRPLFLYLNVVSGTIRQGMSSFGNPAVWWLGIPAALFAIYKLIISRFRNAILIFLLVAYAAQFIPWIFVDRLTFIYHYFPSVPFVVLIITWMFKEHIKRPKIAMAYAYVVLMLFILFYPVLSGMPMNADFVRTYLRWLPGWVFM